MGKRNDATPLPRTVLSTAAQRDAAFGALIDARDGTDLERAHAIREAWKLGIAVMSIADVADVPPQTVMRTVGLIS